MARQLAPRIKAHSTNNNDVPRNAPRSVNSLVSRNKEMNSQKYAAGNKPLGGGQGPGVMDGNPGSY